MKKLTSTFSILIVFFSAAAQQGSVQLFCEDFDTPTSNWQITRFKIPSTTHPGFEQDTNVTFQGSAGAATDTVPLNSVLIRAVSAIQTPNLYIGAYSSVTVQFKHICYISIYDTMRVKYSFDGGYNWTACDSNDYFGGSYMLLPGNYFNKSSNLWLWKYGDPSDTSINNDTMHIWNSTNSSQAWVAERFVIDSTTLFRADSVMFRIELKDGGHVGRGGTHRYYLDDFCVTASNLATDLADLNQTDSQLRLFPNPVTSTFQLNLSKHAVDRLLIRDIQGRVVRQLNSLQKAIRVDVSDLENGIYYLQVEGDGLNQYKKFIKQ